MAVASAEIAGIKRNSIGVLFGEKRRVTFDNSYVTGGKPLAASAFRLHQIKRATASIVSGFAAGFADCDALVQTDGSLLLRLRAAAGTEVANAADAGTVVVDVYAEGF